MLQPPTVYAEVLFYIGRLPVSNALFSTWLVIGLIVFGLLVLNRSLSLVPRGLQNLFEVFIEGLLKITEEIFGNRQAAEKFLPLIASIFIFVLLSNWLGVLPGVNSLGFHQEHLEEAVFVPLLRAAGSDLNFTLALALIAVLAVNLSGVWSLGFLRHLGKFFSFKSPAAFFVGLLELISEVAKIVSFSFRLFGNIFAGEVVLVIAAFFVPYLLPVPLIGFEIFVGFIQAVVFAMLTAVFLSMSIRHH